MANSDAVEPITLTGKNVTAAIDAYLFDALYGQEGIFEKVNKLKATIISNNKIRLSDGLLINQGHFLRIKPGMYEDLTIDNGTQNTKRCDCIVAEFRISSNGETHEIKVVKGTPGTIETVPKLTKNDLENGGSIRQLELYRVHLNGINISGVDKVAQSVYSFNSAVFYYE